MLFPQRMLRLVWFVPEDRLVPSLEFLADSGAFHLSRRCLLGSSRDISAWQQAFDDRQQRTRERTRLQLLDRLPEQTLLHYGLGESTDASVLQAGVLTGEDGMFLWAGSDTPPDAVVAHLYDKIGAPLPDLPLDLDDSQWRLLFDTAASIGYIESWAVIDGWVPDSEVASLRGALKDEPACFVPAETSGLGMERVPVKFSRPAFLDGFGTLMGAFGVTGYRELDPSPFLAIGFIMIFGMMFADLGQGAVMFLAGLWLRGWSLHTDRDAWHRFSQVLIPIGLSAALFGILFGSCFSRDDLIGALWFRPMQQMLFYIGISLLIGMITISFGLILGLFNAWRMGRWRQVLWHHFGPLGLIFYLGLGGVGGGLVIAREDLVMAGGVCCAISMAMVSVHQMYIMRGSRLFMRIFITMLELYDFILRFVIQTASFVRVVAFTVAHLALSEMLMMLTDSLGGHPWAAWSVFIVGNGLIIVVEGALVAIQVLRLHFFEFFTKFVTGEGQLFRPLTRGRERPI